MNPTIGSGPGQVSGGIDTLSCGFYGEHTDYVDLFRVLDTKVEDCKRQRGIRRRPVTFERGGAHFQVHATGVRKGTAEKGVAYPYRISTCGLTFLLMRAAVEKGCAPLVIVDAGALPCTQWGGEGVYEAMRRSLNILGFIVHRDIVSRIDARLDICGMSIEGASEQVKQNRVVSRSRDWRHFESIPESAQEFENFFGSSVIHGVGARCTGYWLGAGSSLLHRGYDKIRELRVHMDERKMEVMEAMVYGCRPEVASRFEWQMRGDWLKERHAGGDHSWGVVSAALPDHLNYAAEHYTKLCEKDFDRRATHRAQPSAIWRRVQAGLRECFGGERPSVRRRAASGCSRESLEKQAWGCVQRSAACASGGEIESLEKRKRDAHAWVERMAKMEEEEVRYREKCVENNASGPGAWSWPIAPERAVLDEDGPCPF